MFEELLKHVMDDEEVLASGVTTYQIACVLAAFREFEDHQPDRSKREDCEKGMHSQTNPLKQYENGFDCDCGAEIRRCGTRNTTVMP